MANGIKVLAGAVLGAVMCCGCAMFSDPVPISPPPITGISVVVKDRATLEKAVAAAAARRRWMPSVPADSTVRGPIVQRQYLVEIDVVLEGENSYSIKCVSCNVPLSKYHQWINNLQREIALQASKIQ